jgi:hypothetical protein
MAALSLVANIRLVLEENHISWVSHFVVVLRHAPRAAPRARGRTTARPPARFPGGCESRRWRLDCAKMQGASWM